MRIEIREQPFDPYAEIDRFQSELDRTGKYGATASFVGSMRNFNEDQAVTAMELEHYPGMTEKHLEEICAQAEKQWSVIDGLVLHRVGSVRIGEAIVVAAVWAAHRGDAFDACRFIIEDLKSRAPFWKKETLEKGERWVEKNTGGYSN